MKWLVSAVRSPVFYFIAAGVAFNSVLELVLGQTIRWIPAWAHVLLIIGGAAGAALSLFLDRLAERKANLD